MNMMELKNKLDACSSVEQINALKETMEKEHIEKMNELNNMKARHDAELDEIGKQIKEAIASKDFTRVQNLLNRQAESIMRQSSEMLSV